MAARAGLSHATIAAIMKGSRPSAGTIKKLAEGFSDGTNERLALEDRLLVLAGYRSERPRERLSELLGALMDKAKQLNDPPAQDDGAFR